MKDKFYSIRKQFAIIFTSLMAGTILFCYLANTFFLKDYYQRTKEESIKHSYFEIEQMVLSSDGNMSSDEFNYEFMQLCNTYNLNVVIVDASFNIIKSNSSDDGMNKLRLLSYILKDDPNFTLGIDEEKPKKIPGRGNNKTENILLEKTEDYALYSSIDPLLSSDYLELWGALDDGNMIFIRTAIDSIRESVSISNHFLLYAGLITIFLCGIIIWFVTKTVTEPITELTDISIRMAKLDFDAKYSGKSNSEIGILGNQINQLSKTLEDTISDLKSANNELKSDLIKKEQIDSIRQEFVANVSHELKTPLAIIQGYAEGLIDGVADNPEEINDYCAVIVDEAQKMNEMVKKLLTLSQYEFGASPAQFERFDIVQLVENCVNTSSILTQTKNITINIKHPDNLYVWADEYMTEEVFLNYLSNAIHYVKGDNKRIDIDISKENDNARVSVFNTGDTIPDEVAANIWRKFYKADKARSREYGGSGVGLSIVAAIMDSLHKNYGMINHEDGVEFFFELDCKEI